jgi:glycerophosphoryl diester phosphodiesterase
VDDLPRIIGHRGAAAEAPENTLAAIRQADLSGARWVEVDVKLTRDGAPILFHDDGLERTSDGTGPMRERTLDELRGLDAGGWFDPRFAGEPVPTLEEALDLCLELGLGLNLEIKPCPGRERETAEVALATLARQWPATAARPLISSFSESSLRVAQQFAPDLPRGFLATALPREWERRAKNLGCTTVNLGWQRLTRAEVDAVRAAGFAVLVYTVNDAERARRLMSWGVRAVFTDAVRALVDAGVGTPPGDPAGAPELVQ